MLFDIFTNTCAAVIATILIAWVVKFSSRYFGKKKSIDARIADLEHYKKSAPREPFVTRIVVFVKMIPSKPPSSEELEEIPPLPQEEED